MLLVFVVSPLFFVIVYCLMSLNLNLSGLARRHSECVCFYLCLVSVHFCFICVSLLAFYATSWREYANSRYVQHVVAPLRDPKRVRNAN